MDLSRWHVGHREQVVSVTRSQVPWINANVSTHNQPSCDSLMMGALPRLLEPSRLTRSLIPPPTPSHGPPPYTARHHPYTARHHPSFPFLWADTRAAVRFFRSQPRALRPAPRSLLSDHQQSPGREPPRHGHPSRTHDRCVRPEHEDEKQSSASAVRSVADLCMSFNFTQCAHCTLGRTVWTYVVVKVKL